MKMSRKLDSSVLGARTFFASAHAIDVCGINGLPLTPNSIRILGKFQKLKTLQHEHLCCYLDAQRGKHERVMVVGEHYLDGLSIEKFRILAKNSDKLITIAFEVLEALSHLHYHGIVHRCLSPNAILFDSRGHVKLSNYGLYYMTEGGASVSFPIGVPKYMAPEVLVSGPGTSFDQTFTSGSKCDVWSLGMILLELIMGVSLWKNLELEDIFSEIFSLVELKTGNEVICSILKQHDAEEKINAFPVNVKTFIEDCLTVALENRPNACDLLSHALFEEYSLATKQKNTPAPSLFLSTQLRCKDFEVHKDALIITEHLAERPLHEVYYLWKLAGGDLEAELRRQELIRAKPPIVTVSNIVVGEGEEFGHQKDRAYLLDDSISRLPLEPLRHRLRDVDPNIYYPLTECCLNGLAKSSFMNGLQETAGLPLMIKERDVEYQLHRIILFKRLLDAYPYKRPQILKEAKIDIPPLYRPWVWAALLDVEGDIQSQYDSIDKETPTVTDRQIEVDIPRCHQYDELLSSPAGHLKFKRILKAWVISHPQYVYWQGLDSLCAPFLSLNFNDEALAYVCLSSFIPKYLYNFFLKDNSSIIQEYLAKFSHLIAYHDPELTNHLDEIGFFPELYAIPWFLTMYTHVFPLHKIFHLWDTLLLGDSCFPLCIGVAILKQLRNNLLSYGFNECILMFSDMPEIDIQRCVQDSIKIFCSTPKSITYREHENPNPKRKQSFQRHSNASLEENAVNSDLLITPLPLHVLKTETCARISAEDLLDLLNLLPEPRNKSRALNIKLLVIDVRPSEDYCHGALQVSINVPFKSGFNSDGNLASPHNQTIESFKGKMIVVIGTISDKGAQEFSNKLVRLGYSRVCTLHGGIEVLKKTGLLVVKINDN